MSRLPCVQSCSNDAEAEYEKHSYFMIITDGCNSMWMSEVFYSNIQKALIINEENTKEIIAVKESLYVIKTHVDLHKASALI